MLKKLKKQFKDKPAFIIGGGESLKDFDFDQLKGHNVVAINSAFKYYLDTTLIYWADKDWEKQNEEELIQHPAPFKIHSRWFVEPHRAKHWYIMPRCTKPFSKELTSVSGNNSGSQVLNLIVNCEPSNIILLGFDMTGGHFHDDYDLVNTHHSFRVNMEEMAGHITVPVINCSPISTLDCFPIEPLSNHLK